MGAQLSFFPVVDEKEVRTIVVKELKNYRALKIQQQNKLELNDKGIKGSIFPKLRDNDLENELKIIQMERALKNLDFFEYEIIKKKYLVTDEYTDINIYLDLGIKKGKYYSKKKTAIINIATALGII
ncbi:ArpU family transcriptional regulator [Cytobacillus solani]|uniref:ArpU family phage packaging/lysis transcriptional regulator n=1 Tax=Cytobacillus solani TaxID=1637975 RepID=UPI00207923C1|nr:ArpU family phage packaging/lysis transcriptional regulator [Cytobacillus solani]USK54384.1 ArpU family transcriptional regulator [Cytobacillus solani]